MTLINILSPGHFVKTLKLANFNSKNDKGDYIFAYENIKQIVLKCSKYGKYVKTSIMR